MYQTWILPSFSSSSSSSAYTDDPNYIFKNNNNNAAKRNSFLLRIWKLSGGYVRPKGSFSARRLKSFHLCLWSGCVRRAIIFLPSHFILDYYYFFFIINRSLMTMAAQSIAGTPLGCHEDQAATPGAIVNRKETGQCKNKPKPNCLEETIKTAYASRRIKWEIHQIEWTWNESFRTRLPTFPPPIDKEK